MTYELYDDIPNANATPEMHYKYAHKYDNLNVDIPENTGIKIVKNNFIQNDLNKKEEKYNEAMDKKYGDCSIETDDWKFIWGITSWDDLSGHEPNMYTMNDIDITYDKQKKEYMLGVETAYIFETYASACNYLRTCLDAFSKYMDANGLDKNKQYSLFMSNPCTSMVADSIEELYTNFKIFVDGFCNQNNTENKKNGG